MILTACPACDTSVWFDWNASVGPGWFAAVCESCQKVMWVESTSLAGVTIDSEDFFARICRPEDVQQCRAIEARALADSSELQGS